MSEQEDVEVKIPKAMADFIRKQKWFKLYTDLEEFVIDAVRHKMLKLIEG